MFIAVAFWQKKTKQRGCTSYKRVDGLRYVNQELHDELSTYDTQGQAEADLMNFAVNSHQRDLWQTCVMRPSMVLPIQPNALQRISSFIIGGIMVDDLARAAVDLTVNGNSKQILEHEDLILLGKNVQQ